MSGIYLHIPFCRQACTYCDFHFSVNLRDTARITDAIIQEMDSRKDEIQHPVRTVYLGGGTPSVLGDVNLEKLFKALRDSFDLSAVEEITMEVNPDDMREERLQQWKSMGIDRLSVGVQSFDDDALRWMNRSHNSLEAIQCLERAVRTGFRSLSADLIFGLPKIFPNRSWEDEIHQMVESGVDHVSMYALTLEERTPLMHQVKKGITPIPSEGIVETEFLLAHNRMLKKGWEHYELSNFCQPNRRSKHNTAYWSGAPYLGLGPSAHSFDGASRRSWNVRSNAAYLRLIRDHGTAIEETEVLNDKERSNEMIMTGLRTFDGLQIGKLTDGAMILNEARKMDDQWFAERSAERIALSPQGMLLSDHIIANLML